MIIVEMEFGSSLYGTSTPLSDFDYKSVFVPPVEDILLQRAAVQSSNRKVKLEGEKNLPGDVDIEAFALHHYLRLLSEGQTLALDMLFAPASAMRCEPAPVWQHLVDNRRRLVSRKTAEFVKYCQRQAAKYGIKGSRIHNLRRIIAWFDEKIAMLGPKVRLGGTWDGGSIIADDLIMFIDYEKLEHASIVFVPQAGDRPDEPHLMCCEKMAGYRTSLDAARAIYQRVLDSYGPRSLMAETNQGVDWKALSHAVRIGYEAMEFLQTAWITFPRPEAKHLLDIKLGKLPYKTVADEIEALVEKVNAAYAISTLPDEPDQEFIDNVIVDVYKDAVIDCK